MSRTAEFVLGLIGSILMIIVWLIITAYLIYQGSLPVTGDTSDYIFLGQVFGDIFLNIPIIVLSWIATFKIKNGSKGWGIFLIVVGGLYALSFYSVCGVLLLIAGILAVVHQSKQKKIDAAAL